MGSISRMSVAAWWVALAGTLVASQAGGCSTNDAGQTCTAGQRLSCSCNGSLSGTVVCDSTGHEGPCQCGAGSGSSSGFSGSSSGASGSSSGSSSGAGLDSGAQDAGVDADDGHSDAKKPKG